MPITKNIKDSESYDIRKLDDGSWLLGIHTKDDFFEFPYETAQELLDSLRDEIMKQDKKKTKKSDFRKMMEEDDENEDDE